ncbi:MAG: hypothetical protein AAGC68_16455, partial [Verrucomicrobiota bacterium]
ARQILTQIFDYIRSTNLHDDTLFEEEFEEAFQEDNQTDHLTYTNPRDENEKGFGHKGHGQVTPIVIDDTKGFGRFPTLSDVAIVVIGAGEPQATTEALYPGLSAFNAQYQEAAEGNAFNNLPPLPNGVNKNTPGSWPTWLRQLRDSGATDEFNAAFDPQNWNWQLAFLDSGYRDAVLRSPTSNKFKPSLITAAASNNMRLQTGERLVQACLVFNLFCPSIGWGSLNPDMEIRITKSGQMNFTDSAGASVEFLGFDDGDNEYIWATNWAKPHKQGGARSWGGLLPFGYTLSARQPLQERNPTNDQRHPWRALWDRRNITSPLIRSRLTPIDKGYDQLDEALRTAGGQRDLGANSAAQVADAYRYDLVTIPFKVRDSGSGVSFKGGDLKFEIFDGGDHTDGSARDDAGSPNLVQTIEVEIPGFNLEAPRMSHGAQGWLNEWDRFGVDSASMLEMASITADPGNPTNGNQLTKASQRGGRNGSGWSYGRMARLVNHWDASNTFIRNGAKWNIGGNTSDPKRVEIVQQVGVGHGDIRLVAADPEVVKGDGHFEPHRNYGKEKMAHSLTNAIGNEIAGYRTHEPQENRDYLLVPWLHEYESRSRPY